MLAKRKQVYCSHPIITACWLHYAPSQRVDNVSGKSCMHVSVFKIQSTNRAYRMCHNGNCNNYGISTLFSFGPSSGWPVLRFLYSFCPILFCLFFLRPCSISDPKVTSAGSGGCAIATAPHLYSTLFGRARCPQRALTRCLREGGLYCGLQ